MINTSIIVPVVLNFTEGRVKRRNNPLDYQGYYFDHPAATEAFAALLQTGVLLAFTD